MSRRNYDLVSQKIHGRLALNRRGAETIEDIAAQVKTWVEIGALWGGSAILTAMANPDLRVISIDPLSGYYGRIDDPYSKHLSLTADAVLDNFNRFGVAHQIALVKARSDPWPLPMDFLVDAVFIDGDHSYHAVLSDWNNAKKVAQKFVLFHDYDDPNIKTMIKGHVDWNVYSEHERMIVFVRD